jgi:hypothetical protein
MAISLDTVYEVIPDNGDSNELLPTIIVDDGVVDVYCSNATTQPSDSSSMQVDSVQIDTTDVYKLEARPRWILFSQSSGTTTTIEIAGITLKE